jgi:hypothetical protein
MKERGTRMHASLTGARGKREDRRGARALVLMIALSVIPLWASRAAADSPPRRPALAGLLPSLRVGVASSRLLTARRASWAVDVWASLAWPLDAISSYDSRSRLPTSARLQAAADDHRKRLAAARVARDRALRALSAADVVDVDRATLEADEAQAELDAIVDGAP